MNSAPQIHTLADAPWYLLLHLALALFALAAGTVMLVRRKGDTLHRRLGWFWVSAMLATALISFAIQARGRFSWIHVLSVVVLVSVPVAVLHIRRGNVQGHRWTMISTFAGLAIAGAFTLLPYRLLGQVVFGAR